MREPAPESPRGSYERPNQPWVCGLAVDGQACAAGPTMRGECPALAECVPLRDGDRWQCNRSDVRGGACDAGPTPDGKCGRVRRCHPVRSLRAKRGRFVAASALFGAAVLMVLLSGDWRDAVIAPGPLSRSHAQLVGHAGAAANCAACHAAAERSVGGWAAATLVGQGDRPSQSDRCLACHQQTILPELALVAHNLPAHELQRISGTQSAANIGSEIACAACHREHQGADFDLSAIDNAACQACHQQRYNSFAGDHPEFGVWPHERRTRIVFSHTSHQAKHFAAKSQSFDCRLCHTDDAAEQVQLTAGYAAACASCHADSVATSVARGVPMLALPTLDTDALREAGHDIGAWPTAATGDFDGRLPPMMKLLLAARPDAAAAMNMLGPDFEFLDVDPDEPAQVAACAVLAEEIKVLFVDLSRRGSAVVRERLSAVLGREIDGAQLDALVAGLSVDIVRGAVAAWMPDRDSVSATTPSEDAGQAPSVPPNNLAAANERGSESGPDLAYGPAGAWTRDDATFTIRYQPVTHEDPVLASWLQVLAATPGLEKRPVELAMFHELARPTAAGLCASCHSVEQSAAGQLAINWRGGETISSHAARHRQQSSAAAKSVRPREFTKFAHGPHLVLPQLTDCSGCHAIDQTAASAGSYADRNPQTFVSEFRPLAKRQCAACHTKTAAGDACQSCHHYHVNTPSQLSQQFVPASVARRLEKSTELQRD